MSGETGPTGDQAGTGIAVLDGGTSYHHFTFTDPTLAAGFDHRVALRGLASGDLTGYGTVIVSCRSNPDLLKAAAPALTGVLERGDRLVVMGETDPQDWLPGIAFTPLPTNYWWWLEPGADLGLVQRVTSHPLLEHVDLKAATWHYHGMFDVPTGAQSLIDCAEGGSILYEDRVSWPGTLIATSLDPIYHHGSFFMPAASRFLRGFLDWVRETASGQPFPSAGQGNQAAPP